MNGRRIGIIGASSAGLALARLMSSFSIEVALAGAADGIELGALVHAATIEEAASPEIVVLAAEFENAAHLLTPIRDWDARILVDATKPIARTDIYPSRRIADLASGAQVIKALGSLPDDIYDRPLAWRGLRHVVFMCGDHPRAKLQFARMLDEVGFRSIDLGGLDGGSILLDGPNGALSGVSLLTVDRAG